jgi:molybdenum cofactor synthesis domain-containing protein
MPTYCAIDEFCFLKRKIRDSNRYSLLAAMKEMGVKSVDLGIASDTEESLRTMITDGLSQADILLTSGGVSMGELDLIQPILQGLSGTIHFGRVKMKPGKPLTFASVDFNGKKRLVFGLPGNPVSSVVTFYLSAVPCIRKMSGHPNPNLPSMNVKTKQALKLDPERPEYHRANLSWDTESNMFMATSTGSCATNLGYIMIHIIDLLFLHRRYPSKQSSTLVMFRQCIAVASAGIRYPPCWIYCAGIHNWSIVNTLHIASPLIPAW